MKEVVLSEDVHLTIAVLVWMSELPARGWGSVGVDRVVKVLSELAMSLPVRKELSPPYPPRRFPTPARVVLTSRPTRRLSNGHLLTTPLLSLNFGKPEQAPRKPPETIL